MNDLFASIRNYCERTGDELWSEPVNALTNLSFFIAAWMLFKAYKATGHKNMPTLAMIGLVALVGFGSTLFHTFANGVTMLADVIPIAIFTFYYLWNALRHLLRVSRITSIAYLLAFAAVGSQTGNAPVDYRFNGSIDYLPCLGALLLVSAALYIRRHNGAKRIALAALIFVVSLTFRSIDFSVCPTFPLGTHFIWHTLNGIMLYLLVSVFVRPAIIKK